MLKLDRVQYIRMYMFNEALEKNSNLKRQFNNNHIVREKKKTKHHDIRTKKAFDNNNRKLLFAPIELLLLV